MYLLNVIPPECRLARSAQQPARVGCSPACDHLTVGSQLLVLDPHCANGHHASHLAAAAMTRLSDWTQQFHMPLAAGSWQLQCWHASAGMSVLRARQATMLKAIVYVVCLQVMTFESEAQRSRFAHGWLVSSSSLCQLHCPLQLALHAVLQLCISQPHQQTTRTSCDNCTAFSATSCQVTALAEAAYVWLPATATIILACTAQGLWTVNVSRRGMCAHGSSSHTQPAAWLGCCRHHGPRQEGTRGLASTPHM